MADQNVKKEPKEPKGGEREGKGREKLGMEMDGKWKRNGREREGESEGKGKSKGRGMRRGKEGGKEEMKLNSRGVEKE